MSLHQGAPYTSLCTCAGGGRPGSPRRSAHAHLPSSPVSGGRDKMAASSLCRAAGRALVRRPHSVGVRGQRGVVVAGSGAGRLGTTRQGPAGRWGRGAQRVCKPGKVTGTRRVRAGGEAAAPGVGPGRLRAAGCERSWAEERGLGGHWHPGGLFYGGRLVSGSDGCLSSRHPCWA